MESPREQRPGPAGGRPTTCARTLGERGEEAVAAWYRSRGYDIIARNWRCAEGELDIVAANSVEVVFVEVKSRANERFADPALAVDYRKQAKVRRAALRWLEGQRLRARLRFDVGVVVSGRVRIIEAAF